MDRHRTPASRRPGSRVDMHCHSSASELSRLGVQRAAGLPECATPPEEVYELAKRRGMDFVTITDHDTIDGVLEIADRPDVFISEELTASFRGEPQAVHVLCYGIDPDDHEWLQANRGDVELCAAYMFERAITCALAHPYYTVAAPLAARHRRRLAELFGIWETRNGARPRELNSPAATYVATRDAIGIGGSDDHAGVDIGRTYTQAPPARTPAEFLAHVRSGDVLARGEEGSAAKWAHAAIALAARALGTGERRGDPRIGGTGGIGGTGLTGSGGAGAPPDPARVMTLVRRLLHEGDARQGPDAGDRSVTPDDARSLLRAWMSAVELDGLDERGLIERMQAEDFTHADLQRRALRIHERKLRDAVVEALAAVGGRADVSSAAAGVFEACVAAIPYAPASAFLARERAKLAEIPYAAAARPPRRAEWRSEDVQRPRVAIIADGIGATHGVTRTIEEIRARGVRGFDIEVVGTDPEVDRRLASVAEFEVPFYEGLRIGVPSLPAAVQALADGRFDVIHVCSPGPAGVAGALLARAMGLPLVGSYHTELGAYAGLRSGDRAVAHAAQLAVSAFYNACDIVLSPSSASDGALATIGVGSERVLRWDRGVDAERFDPGLRERANAAGDGREPIRVLYSGRITVEKGVELLADAFLLARERDPRLELVLAGGGPEEAWLRERLGDACTPLGWLRGRELARAYANADIFLFPSRTDTFGQVILEAQASGLPVVAVAEGGPLSLVEHRVSGVLCEPNADAVAAALLDLACAPLLREHLSRGGLRSARARTWERTLELLADGYRRVLARDGADALAPTHTAGGLAA